MHIRHANSQRLGGSAANVGALRRDANAPSRCHIALVFDVCQGPYERQTLDPTRWDLLNDPHWLDAQFTELGHHRRQR